MAVLRRIVSALCAAAGAAAVVMVAAPAASAAPGDAACAGSLGVDYSNPILASQTKSVFFGGHLGTDRRLSCVSGTSTVASAAVSMQGAGDLTCLTTKNSVVDVQIEWHDATGAVLGSSYLTQVTTMTGGTSFMVRGKTDAYHLFPGDTVSILYAGLPTQGNCVTGLSKTSGFVSILFS